MGLCMLKMQSNYPNLQFLLDIEEDLCLLYLRKLVSFIAKSMVFSLTLIVGGVVHDQGFSCFYLKINS